jgi:hypothetical protein
MLPLLTGPLVLLCVKTVGAIEDNLSSGIVRVMCIVTAKIQTVEGIYEPVWIVVANKQPVRAISKERPRLICPNRLGRNQPQQMAGEDRSESGN